MDDLRVGAVGRLVRRRRSLRQGDVARLAGVSQSEVSRFERGQLERLSLRAIRKIGHALEIALPFEPRWRGGDLAWLLDAEHAAIVERCVRELRGLGFEVLVEYSFSVYGERGSVDVVGWHPILRALLIVEVKARIVDLQDLAHGLDRKTRLVPGLLARERGWHAQAVGRVAVAPGTTANRSIVARHAATFATAFPGRAAEVRRWLRRPAGSLSALWFLSNIRPGTGTRTQGGPKRVRVSAPSVGGRPKPPRESPEVA